MVPAVLGCLGQGLGVAHDAVDSLLSIRQPFCHLAHFVQDLVLSTFRQILRPATSPGRRLIGHFQDTVTRFNSTQYPAPKTIRELSAVIETKHSLPTL